MTKLDKPTYWVNKNSGAIYMVYNVKDYNGNPKGTMKELVLKTIWNKAIIGKNIKYIQLLIWLGVFRDE